MDKINKECVIITQLIKNVNKFNTPTRIRLRKKLNKSLDDMINDELEIDKLVTKLSMKMVKKYNCDKIKLALEENMEIFKNEDKKMDLIKFD